LLRFFLYKIIVKKQLRNPHIGLIDRHGNTPGLDEVFFFIPNVIHSKAFFGYQYARGRMCKAVINAIMLESDMSLFVVIETIHIQRQLNPFSLFFFRYSIAQNYVFILFRSGIRASKL
jgi:hypothetical protein